MNVVLREVFLHFPFLLKKYLAGVNRTCTFVTMSAEDVTHIRIYKTTLEGVKKAIVPTRQTIFGFIDLAILEKIARDAPKPAQKKAAKKK